MTRKQRHPRPRRPGAGVPVIAATGTALLAAACGGGGGGRPRGRSRARRAAVLTAAVAGTSLLAAACGGGSSTQTNTFAPGATYTQALAFAKCMRSNGVPDFPDPDRQGDFNNATVNALTSNNSGDNALHECRSVLPNAGTGLTDEQIQQIQQANLRNAVKAAHCMRAHGIENFPDPAGTTQASGVNWQPVMSAEQAGGFNQNSPSYEKAFTACGGPIPPNFAPGATPPPDGPGSGSGPVAGGGSTSG
jgi:hypothetical protein